jgi:hypothetical protein
MELLELDKLPEEFKDAHSFAVFLHDCIAGLLVDGKEAEVFGVEVNFRKFDVVGDIENLHGEELIHYLEGLDDGKTVEDVIIRTAVAGLIVDLCHFIYEGLNCSRKGKIAVAYSLFRKPFKDNLLYLEWILVDPQDFLYKFLRQDVEEITPAKKKGLTEDKKRKVISKSIEMLETTYFKDAELIYDLRYNKSSGFGFEKIWNKAIHLITTDKHYKTEQRNFNFLFQKPDGTYDSWEHIYATVPMLLAHTLEIIMKLIDGFCILTDEYKNNIRLRKAVGLIIYGRSKILKVEQNDDEFSLIEITGNPNCGNCGHRMEMRMDDFRSLYLFNKVVCNKCRADIEFCPERFSY